MQKSRLLNKFHFATLTCLNWGSGMVEREDISQVHWNLLCQAFLSSWYGQITDRRKNMHQGLHVLLKESSCPRVYNGRVLVHICNKFLLNRLQLAHMRIIGIADYGCIFQMWSYMRIINAHESVGILKLTANAIDQTKHRISRSDNVFDMFIEWKIAIKLHGLAFGYRLPI